MRFARRGVGQQHITFWQADNFALLRELTQGFDDPLVTDLEANTKAIGGARLRSLSQQGDDLIENKIVGHRFQSIRDSNEVGQVFEVGLVHRQNKKPWDRQCRVKSDYVFCAETDGAGRNQVGISG